jgi:hypothetical protein
VAQAAQADKAKAAKASAPAVRDKEVKAAPAQARAAQAIRAQATTRSQQPKACLAPVRVKVLVARAPVAPDRPPAMAPPLAQEAPGRTRA